jgi:hypothetical protein
MEHDTVPSTETRIIAPSALLDCGVISSVQKKHKSGLALASSSTVILNLTRKPCHLIGLHLKPL